MLPQKIVVTPKNFLLEVLVKQFNSVTPENSNDPEKTSFFIMTLMKCTTLKYLTKTNHYPYSV